MNVFEYAREIETSGQRFYGDMAAHAKDNGIRNIFTMLAEDEARMLTLLHELEARYDTTPQECLRLGPGGNVFAGLHKREDRLQVGSDLEAYRLAMRAEQAIIDRYLAAIEAEPDPQVKTLLQRIVALEQQELDDLQRLCDFVDAPNHFLEWGEFSNLDEFHNFGRYES